MIKVMNDNSQNTNTNYMSFELKCGYYPHMSLKKDKDFCFYLKTIDKLVVELQKLVAICRKNFYHI